MSNIDENHQEIKAVLLVLIDTMKSFNAKQDITNATVLGIKNLLEKGMKESQALIRGSQQPIPIKDEEASDILELEAVLGKLGLGGATPEILNVLQSLGKPEIGEDNK